ncbi:MAG: L,D-transpeptidase family protein [Coprococcus sp.]|nr:L,D-transpeptidase family protein [Coprococcus sp.]
MKKRIIIYLFTVFLLISGMNGETIHSSAKADSNTPLANPPLTANNHSVPSSPKPVFTVVSKRKGTAYITWKKVKGASGIELYYKRAGSSYRKVKGTTNKTTNRTLLTKLSSGKVYYFKMRSYKMVNGTKVYGKYTTKKIRISKKASYYVEKLSAADTESQLCIVKANGTRATISLHNRRANGTWYQVLSTTGYIGWGGIGKTKEGDGKTPVGTYHFNYAFGIKTDPGCSIKYTKVDDSYYLVDDSASKYYNKFVSTDNVICDWNSAEHITSIGAAYHYVLSVDYNKSCKKGLGSGIFLHCSTGRPTAGCISVPEKYMKKIMKRVKPNCLIIIDDRSNISKY